MLVNLGLGYAMLGSFLIIGMTLMCFLCLNDGETDMRRVIGDHNSYLLRMIIGRQVSAQIGWQAQHHAGGGGNNRTESASARIFRSLKKFTFSSLSDAMMQECVICMEEFKDSDEVAELKCDERHYFHSKCLEDWLKRKLECPLCKKIVIAEDE